jgi:branched-chain amino acid transport system ATP-binding protein
MIANAIIEESRGTVTPVLLCAEGLRKAFGGQVVLDGVNLELRRGEVVLLRGENGSGKTTLLNILTGNLEPDVGTIHYLADGSPRTYNFPRLWWQELNPFDHFVPEFVAREGMGRTWQDVRLFGSQTLRDNITVAEPGHPGENPLMALITPSRSVRKEKQLRDQADTILSRFGLAGREDSSADKISLGQSKRVAIARAVAAGAKILFLDEPLAGLDRQGIADVLGLLKTLVHEHALTLVIVEHVFNQPHLHGLVTSDWLLADGKLRVSSDASTINHQPSSTTRPSWFQLLAGESAEIIEEPLSCGALLTRIRRPDRFKPDAPPALEVCDLIVKRGSRTVIAGEDSDSSGMNLTVNAGEIVLLQAPNGWGKSSLMHALSGLIAIDSGSISLLGKPIESLSPWERVKQGMQALPSNGTTFPSLQVREALVLSGGTDRQTFATRFDGRSCSSLSGGERQKLALSCIDASGVHHSVQLLDEPFAMLDVDAIRSAIAMILDARNATTVIFSPTST